MSENVIKSFSHWIRKNKVHLLPTGVALVLIVIVLIIVFESARKSAPAEYGAAPIAADGSSGVKAQSYLASQAPVVRPNDKIFGSASAPLKVFVYEDYTNPYSAALADTLEKISVEVGNKLALVIRPFALSNSSSAIQAAAAVDCAYAQGKWREMRALLFARAKNQQAGSADFASYAKQIGLNDYNFQACLTNEEKSGKIEQSIEEAKTYSVQGAPTLFIGSEMILGARPYADFTDSNGDKIEGLKTVIQKKLSNI